MSVEDVLAGTATWGVECADVLAFLRSLPDGCVQCAVTSPPYYNLRHYGADGQIGLESTPRAYIARLVEVFRETWRVLRGDGTFWLNVGDGYCNAGSRNNGTGLDGKRRGGVRDTDGTWEDAQGTYRDIRRAFTADGIKHKDLLMVPARLAIALQEDGWYLRQEITLCKLSPMPESVRDRCSSATEKLYHFSKEPSYFYDQDAERVPAKRPGDVQTFGGQKAIASDIGEEDPRFRNGNEQWGRTVQTGLTGRNLWNYWTWHTEPMSEGHFAAFPSWLPERCIKLGSSEKGCCPKCRAPYRRITERKKVQRERPNEYVKRTGEKGTGNSCGNTVAGVEMRTLGWEASCDCGEASVIPCLCLDPFMGSGTTAIAALRLGRRVIGCDLNHEYVALARRRILNSLGTVKDDTLPATDKDRLALFE